MFNSRLLTASSLAAIFTAGTLAYVTPQTAEACGGTFCDAGPQQMPVDQTGENILFVIDGADVEAQIQIQYDPETDAEKFAWVIPLLAVPEFAVGSDPLFNNLLAGSVPSYSLNQRFEFCGGGDGQTDGGGTGFAGDSGGGTSGGYDPTGMDGPDVLLEQTVGAFDIVVLEDDNVDSLMQWLGDNGYQQDPAAAPIFEEYLGENYLFAAFKLTHGAGVDQIHPISLKFNTGEACIPLRLTRIAAQEDMEVRTFFLGNSRTVPRNYRHVLINPLKIDWLDLTNVAENYKEVITQAVDAFKADGHAFVTEYAGTSSIINQFGLHSDAWNSGALLDVPVTGVVDTLQSQGLLGCFGNDFCEFYHPLAEGLLAEFLPVPDGMTAGEFYSCLECFEGLIDQDAWNVATFAAAYQSRIIDPGAHAVELLQTWPYLTRMYTTISPGEMTEDPVFDTNPDLADVPAIRTATQMNLCNGNSIITLPDGREVNIPAGEGWPAFDDEMPWEAEVQTVMMSGAPMTLVDNNEIIDQKLAEWNAKVDPHGDAFSETGDDTSDEGCNCSASSDNDGRDGRTPLGLALGLLILGFARRRRG